MRSLERKVTQSFKRFWKYKLHSQTQIWWAWWSSHSISLASTAKYNSCYWQLTVKILSWSCILDWVKLLLFNLYNQVVSMSLPLKIVKYWSINNSVYITLGEHVWIGWLTTGKIQGTNYKILNTIQVIHKNSDQPLLPDPLIFQIKNRLIKYNTMCETLIFDVIYI